MDRRIAHIALVIFITALTVGILPVIPVGEVLAPERSVAANLDQSTPTPTGLSVSPVADASTLEKLRHLFCR